MPGIILLGLGPGDPLLLTRQAWQILEEADEIILRTRQHPVIAGLPAGLEVHSFDDLYESSASFEETYSRIVEQVLALARRPQGVIYAVPGHPLVAESTVPQILRRARLEGLSVQVIEGLSFLEPSFTALGFDPFPQMALVDAFEMAKAHHPPFSPAVPLLIAQIHSRQMASDVKLTLMAVYPDEHPVTLLHAAGTPDCQVEQLLLYEIDRSDRIGLLTSLYVPPMSGAASLESFQDVIAHLRDPQGGCPWDLRQNHQTLRPNLLEEAYELLAALDADDPAAMREELGDLLLQIVMHTQLASEYGEFSMAEVIQGIRAKIIHRHPHVFAGLDLKDEQGVLENWERLKAAERESNGQKEKSLLDGVSVGLPALNQAQEYQGRAARVGFDWHDLAGVLDKLAEEIGELQNTVDLDERAAELGDVLFSLVNLARWLDVDAESALRQTNTKFRQRFSYIERAAKAQGRELKQMSLAELDALWDEAKLQP